MNISVRQLSVCLLSGLLLSACATWSQHNIRPIDEGQYPIAILPIQVTAQITKLSDIVDQHPDVTDEKAEIHARMQVIAEKLSDLLQHKLTDGTIFKITPLHTIPGQTMPDLPDPEQSWTREDFLRLGIPDDAQAVLLVRLAGYGSLKREWVTFLIGTGIIEGIVQGVVAARVFDNTAVGFAVGLEEIAQEYLTWGGGSYLFNTYFAPVTLQAQLISTSDGQSVWSKTIFVSVDRKAIKQLPENQRSREKQLELTATKAIDELANSLEKAAQNNLPSNMNSDIATVDNPIHYLSLTLLSPHQ